MIIFFLLRFCAYYFHYRFLFKTPVDLLSYDDFSIFCRIPKSDHGFARIFPYPLFGHFLSRLFGKTDWYIEMNHATFFESTKILFKTSPSRLCYSQYYRGYGCLKFRNFFDFEREFKRIDIFFYHFHSVSIQSKIFPPITNTTEAL